MTRFDGKVVVITGGSSGIGLATAQEFHNLGAQVVITGRDRATLEQATDQIGANVLAIQADVTSIANLDGLFNAVRERFGGVDVLFVNAGIGRFSALGETEEALFDEVIDTNFKGAFFTIQKALPLLRDGASIILNGSVNAHVGFANASVYSASKAAVHSLARTLGAELIGRGIRVNTLNIGPVETPLYGKINLPPEVLQGFAQTLTGRLPIKRFGQPEEIAKAAVFLASPDASFIVGSELTTDGGFAINAL
jgi:NAD(P)-dependent dehydrogenase (short-subunit alcohol dehydrogenase family)